jgi:hypothetical protein
MRRRTFLKSITNSGIAAVVMPTIATARTPSHNWNPCDYGAGPTASDRLYQGPFPQYPPEAFLSDSDVVMTTSASREIVPNFGMGLTVYVSGDYWPMRTGNDSVEKYLEDLIRLPFVQKVYIRLNWCDIQIRPGKLDLPEAWKQTFSIARSYGKRVAFRVMLENPDYPEPGLPTYLLDRIPYVPLKGEWKARDRNFPKGFQMPRYDLPLYQAAFTELNQLLAQEYNGNPEVEYVDAFLYGFWGEGHTWPFENHPFASDAVAEDTWIKMFETQLQCWSKTLLVMNTQPDWSRVGNSELLARAVQTNNWLRTDSIFIENEQIEVLSNRPSWIAAISEAGLTSFDKTENIIQHVTDIGANYWSIWNFHNISASNVLRHYERFKESFDRIARCVGYRIRPSWIWSCRKDGVPGLIFGFVNDGISDVPGILRITVFSEGGSVNVSGSLDAGYPKTRGVRQAMVMLPQDTDWRGLRLKAELEVKGVVYPVRWACREELNRDGSLTLRRSLGND